MKSQIIIWLLLLIAGNTIAQSPEADILKVLNQLQNSPHLYFENQYLYYENGAASAAETLHGLFHRNGKNQFASMGKIEMLQIEGIAVSMDHDEKIVAAASVEAISSNSLANPLDFEKIQSLVGERTAMVAYCAAKGSNRAVTIKDPAKPDELWVVEFDPSNWVIKEVRITRADPYENPWENSGNKVTVVIKFQNYSLVAKPFPYKLETYVRKIGKGYAPAGKCKGYKMQNHL